MKSKKLIILSLLFLLISPKKNYGMRVDGRAIAAGFAVGVTIATAVYSFVRFFRGTPLRETQEGGAAFRAHLSHMVPVISLHAISPEHSSKEIADIWDEVTLRKKLGQPEDEDSSPITDPAIMFVPMYQGKFIKLLPGQGFKQRTIFTNGLVGCNACAVYVLYEDGQQDCILTHYPPGRIAFQGQHIRILGQKFDRTKTIKKIRLVCVYKGKLEEKIHQLDILESALHSLGLESDDYKKVLLNYFNPHSGYEGMQTIGKPAKFSVVLHQDQEDPILCLTTFAQASLLRRRLFA